MQLASWGKQCTLIHAVVVQCQSVWSVTVFNVFGHRNNSRSIETNVCDVQLLFLHPFLQTSAHLWLQNISFELAGYPRCVFIYDKGNFSHFHSRFKYKKILNVYCRYILIFKCDPETVGWRYMCWYLGRGSLKSACFNSHCLMLMRLENRRDLSCSAAERSSGSIRLCTYAKFNMVLNICHCFPPGSV